LIFCFTFSGRQGRDFGRPPNRHGGGPNGAHYDGPPPIRAERRGRKDEGPPGISLLVRNVAPDITLLDLQGAFGRIGVIRDVYIPRDFHSQQPRGFAFIEYATPEMAREAKHEMDRFVIKGHEIEVVFAQERRKTPREMRGRGSEAGDDDDQQPPPPSSRGENRRGGGGGFER
jgi:FUS-interacting serine-arginine-rich protein 1